MWCHFDRNDSHSTSDACGPMSPCLPQFKIQASLFLSVPSFRVFATFPETNVNVIACDPAALDANVLQRPNVIHQRCRVEQVDWTAISRAESGFALLCCDMNGMDARDLMRLMLTLAPLMALGAVMVASSPHSHSQSGSTGMSIIYPMSHEYCSGAAATGAQFNVSLR